MGIYVAVQFRGLICSSESKLPWQKKVKTSLNLDQFPFLSVCHINIYPNTKYRYIIGSDIQNNLGLLTLVAVQRFSSFKCLKLWPCKCIADSS